MLHRFPSKDDFFLYQDLYFNYLLEPILPLRMLLSLNHGYEAERATCAIYNAHFDMLFYGFEPLQPTTLGRKENRLCTDAYNEMNVALMRSEERRNGAYHYLDIIRKHIVRFPCECESDDESFVDLPPEHEELLKNMASFYRAICDFDTEILVSWYAAHYQRIDEGLLRQRLDHLKGHFKASVTAKQLSKTATEALEEQR